MPNSCAPNSCALETDRRRVTLPHRWFLEARHSWSLSLFGGSATPRDAVGLAWAGFVASFAGAAPGGRLDAPFAQNAARTAF